MSWEEDCLGPVLIPCLLTALHGTRNRGECITSVFRLFVVLFWGWGGRESYRRSSEGSLRLVFTLYELVYETGARPNLPLCNSMYSMLTISYDYAGDKRYYYDNRECLLPTQSGHSVDVIVSLLNFNQRATGSTPVRPTNYINDLGRSRPDPISHKPCFRSVSANWAAALSCIST